MAMVEVLKAPENDRFQVITEHDEDRIVFAPTCFGIERSPMSSPYGSLWPMGRTLEQTRGLCKQVVDELNERLNLRHEDVFTSLTGPGRDDWSFGNGDASLVKS
jgi:4-oxalocrotonate tautomerase